MAETHITPDEDKELLLQFIETENGKASLALQAIRFWSERKRFKERDDAMREFQRARTAETHYMIDLAILEGK